jgi:hypothetical protein
LSSTEIIDHKRGIKTKTKNLKFDLFNGEPTEVLNTDALGNKFVTRTVPAYTIPSYKGSWSTPGMDLKIQYPHNKNMLIQNAATYIFKVNDSYEANPVNQNVTGLLGASIQTWNDNAPVLSAGTQPGIFRKHRSYVWIGDKTLNSDGTYAFDANNLFNNSWWKISEPPTPKWQKTGEITLYNPYSHALEAMDINGNKAATLMDIKQQQVIASAAGSAYKEFMFTGGEENHPLGGTLSTEKSHTGTRSLKLIAGATAWNFMINGTRKGHYIASVWTTNPSAMLKFRVNNVERSAVNTNNGKSGEWHLISAQVAVNPGDKLEVFCHNTTSFTVFFDDFRVHPVNSSMSSYVYNQWGELSAVLDGNNIATWYEYNAMGQLEKVYRESFPYGKKLVRSQIINYQNF